MTPEQPLEGGHMSCVVRVGETVHRDAGPWTPRVHALLSLLHAKGMVGVPRPLGMDEQGREVLSFLHGQAGGSPPVGAQRSDRALVQAAQMLRALHDATAGVATSWTSGWRLPSRAPVEVICHGDFAPYNGVFVDGDLVGVFDFDFAHPGPRRWDLAYALYRFAPLADPDRGEGFGSPPEQARRLRLFCDAYGLDDRSGLMRVVSERLQWMVDILLDGQAVGDARRVAAVDAGHHRIYRGDLAYLERHRATFESALAAA